MLPMLAAGAGVVGGARVLGLALRRKKSIKGKVVLITGASKGLGAEMAVAFAKEGVKLCLVARSQKLLDAVAAECKKAGAQAVTCVACDVSTASACEDVVAKCKAAIGPVEILINNAAIETTSKMQHTSAKDLQQMCNVNVAAPMMLSQMVLPDMLAAKYGVVCCISSGLGGMSVPYLGNYGATKSAINAFCSSLHAELSGTGVSCFALMPGIITKLKTGGMASDIVGGSVETVNPKFSLNPMDYFFRCTGASVINKTIKHVKMGGPNPVVGGMRMPVAPATMFCTLFPATAPKMLWATLPPAFKNALEDNMAARGAGK